MTGQCREPDETMDSERATPLSLAACPTFAMAQVIEPNSGLAAHQLASQTSTVAYFFVLEDPDITGGVVKGVFNDLKTGNKVAIIEYQEVTTDPLIRIESPKEEAVLALVRTANQLAATHLSGLTPDSKLIFVEPPSDCSTINFNIDVQPMNADKHARPMMRGIPGPPDTKPEATFSGYEDRFSEDLCDAFQRAAGLYATVTLKIHLGYYLLHTYQPGQYTIERFQDMVKNPRATGQLITQLGKAPFQNELRIEAIMRKIRADDSPCVPIDNQINKSIDVAPVYVFESWHDDDRYETELDSLPTSHGLTKLCFSRTKVIPRDAQIPQFEAVSISIGRKLDWSIMATPGDEKIRAKVAVINYFKMGTADLRGSLNDFNVYPVVRLPERNPVGKKLKRVAIKSIYRFSWKKTCFIIQVTINRRWDCVRDMNRHQPAETDFDVTIYADHWDENNRVQSMDTAENFWGDDLQNLLRDEAGFARKSGFHRVQELIKTILDIREFFDSSAYVQQ